MWREAAIIASFLNNFFWLSLRLVNGRIFPSYSHVIKILFIFFIFNWKNLPILIYAKKNRQQSGSIYKKRTASFS
jgi:hypothetical protein